MDEVHYIKRVGFVVGWAVDTKDDKVVRTTFSRLATDKEIGRALRTGRLYNTTNLKLINEMVEFKN